MANSKFKSAIIKKKEIFHEILPKKKKNIHTPFTLKELTHTW